MYRDSVHAVFAFRLKVVDAVTRSLSNLFLNPIFQPNTMAFQQMELRITKGVPFLGI